MHQTGCCIAKTGLCCPEIAGLFTIPRIRNEGQAAMLDIKRQSQIADAAADAMRASALAAGRTVSRWMCRGMSLWARMLSGSAPASAAGDAPHARSENAPPREPAEPAFSSYRSSGGHAVAQVIVPDEP
jgi:mevalonate pyrophosphate decarboxylase